MKRLVLVVLILLGGGLFFYLWTNPVEPVEGPISPLSASTAQESPPKPAQEPQATQEPTPGSQTNQNQGPRVAIGAVNIPVELAKTPAEVQKGLSGRLSLDQDKGMLFLFSEEGNYRFWMPDMHFPIDIIWIDDNKRIVGVSANVSNEFDPANPKFYSPPSPARYVLEVNAGFVSRTGIKIGNSATFSNI